MSSATALDAYWNFFRAFNSRDVGQFSAALNYPHVRVSPSATPEIVTTSAVHAADVSWQSTLAAGWHRIIGHEPAVVHQSDDRAHIVGGWARADENEDPALANPVSYVATRTGDGWGIQSRFAIDAGDGAAKPRDDRPAQAVALVEDYVDAYNDRDWALCAALMATPHFKIDVGMVREWQDEDGLRRAFEDGPWHFVTELSARAVQGGEHSVAVALDGALDGGDRAVLGLFFCLDRGDGLRIQARSIIED